MTVWVRKEKKKNSKALERNSPPFMKEHVTMLSLCLEMVENINLIEEFSIATQHERSPCD